MGRTVWLRDATVRGGMVTQWAPSHLKGRALSAVFTGTRIDNPPSVSALDFVAGVSWYGPRQAVRDGLKTPAAGRVRIREQHFNRGLDSGTPY